jgi:hypothetical protein
MGGKSSKSNTSATTVDAGAGALGAGAGAGGPWKDSSSNDPQVAAVVVQARQLSGQLFATLSGELKTAMEAKGPVAAVSVCG